MIIDKGSVSVKDVRYLSPWGFIKVRVRAVSQINPSVNAFQIIGARRNRAKNRPKKGKANDNI